MERKYGCFYTREMLLNYYSKKEVDEYISALEKCEKYVVEKSELVKSFEQKLDILPHQAAMAARGRDYIYRQRFEEWNKTIFKLIAKNDKLIIPVLRDFFLYNECVAEYGYRKDSGEQLAYMVLESKRPKAYKKLLSKLIVDNCPYGPEFGFAAAKISNYNLSQEESDYLSQLKRRNDEYRQENLEMARKMMGEQK